MTFLGRDALEVDALVTDRYLESLLAGHAPVPGDGRGGAMLDREVRFAAHRLGLDLPHFYPSFRFEERLGRRLADLAASLRFPAAAGAEGVVIPFGGIGPGGVDPATADLLDELAGFDDPRRPGRPLLIGGAITSAALSLAGVAWVAWRRNHPAATPMARAIRAVNAARTRLA